ncbi:hypothetical protein ES703_10016 [subsurface metagenome]
MNRLNYSDLLFLKHTINTCLFFRKSYHIQSRNTQRALILKRFGVEIPIATFDRAIKRSKKRWGLMKQHRTGKVAGGGHRWTSAITGISWVLVMFMWRLGELTREQFEALKRIFGLVKKKGPAKLRATPTQQVVEKEGLHEKPSLSPT